MTMSSTNHWKLGMFVLCSLAVFIGVAFWLGAKRFDRETFYAYTYLDEAVDGLDIGSPVKFRGVQIGSVSSIRAAPDRVLLEIEAKIDVKSVTDLGLNDPSQEDVSIRTDLRAQLNRTWVTGVAWVQISFFDEDAYPIPSYNFEPRENVMHAVPSPQRSLEIGLQESLHRVPALMDSITSTSDSLGHAVDSIDFKDLSVRLSRLLQQVNELLGDVDGAGLVAESQHALADLRRTLNSIENLADGLAQDGSGLHRSIDELHEVLAVIKQVLTDSDPSQTLAGIRDATNEFSLLMRSLRRLSAMLERDPGALLHGREATPLPIPEGR